MVSKRSLRPDPNFDLLISKIYPSRDEYEAHQERVLAKLNKSHSQAALVNSITEGIKLQSQNRPQRSRKNANESENASNATSYNNTPNVSAPTTPNPSTNVANQSDSSQSATGPLNSGGMVSLGNINISQPVINPTVSLTISKLLLYLCYFCVYQGQRREIPPHHRQILRIKFQKHRNDRRAFKILKMTPRVLRLKLAVVTLWLTRRVKVLVNL